ncbi:[citrate (pro-3S)-lyase] ligase [Candidatus Epulonipiscium fishelsonii]|uniref:[citrate (Pro-3S)-lyase] ligase n=1 Tax=Candidatus Epulonipiscium fishelsonii TaxID=77094 RepID=A0ACC8X9V8_9FIRM|nr:[citrate (pro-3S)-lyase] ligase [Epulopiscium sp. SCG-B11WGA-EpuloA1]ONI43775.1 [citrate (pro-3S)-lyase] ligase [Epulopiscium sp. SCG-B05WGA-EpuloA1]
MFYDVENILTEREKLEVEQFLWRFQLKYEEVDDTIVLRDNGKIIATCSKLGNVLKCFAVDDEYQGMGLTNILVSNMTDKLHEQNIFHHFIFTKPESTYLFEMLAYKNIYTTDKVALLETGNQNINKYLKQICKKYNIDPNKEYAAIVMNCNPFTLGHRYLIETTSKENENVIVFVVEEDKSAFSFKDRIELVKKGTEDLDNVNVIPAGNYIISMATFPSYFLKKEDDVLKVYTELDCNIFGKYFAKEMGITKRYMGNEPTCNVTNMYNSSMEKILPKYGLEIKVIERKQIGNQVISASRVRNLLEKGELSQIKEMVPKTTYDFLVKHKEKYI